VNRIEWSQLARQDLLEIHAYIARDSPQYALRTVKKIKAAVEGVQLFPLSGAIVPEWDRGDVREIFVGNYRVIYQADEEAIRVLTVIHSARRLPKSHNGE